MHIFVNYKKINKQTKEKHLTTEQENIKKRIEVETKYHIQKCKMYNEEP